MPELPEVETTKNGLTPLVLNKKIIDLTLYQGTFRKKVTSLELEPLIGQAFTYIKRRAKYLIFYTKNPNFALLIHLGMSGSLRYCDNNLPLQKHDHLVINFADQTQLRYYDPRKFGLILPISPQDPPDFIQKLGAEPLESDFTADYLAKFCQSSQAIKLRLMAQEIVVGIGNIYANEALFLAEINPNRPANSLSYKELSVLVEACKLVLRKAISKGGTTLRDFSHSNQQTGYFQQVLQVYGRKDQPCVRCQNPLQANRLGNRQTVFCTHCQK